MHTRNAQTTLCIVMSLSTLISGAPYKEGRDKKPDIEEFIDRLLTSDKFEKLADKIAEKAADKIITLQHASGNYDKKTDSARARVDSKESKETEKHKSSKLKFHNKKDHSDESGEKKAKPKIDSVAAIQKFGAFPVEELSLNYKHFTTKEPKFGSAIGKGKDSDDSYEGRSKKKRHEKKKNKKNEDMYKRVHQGKPERSSDSSIEKKESDLSIDAIISKDEEEEELKAMDTKKEVEEKSSSSEEGKEKVTEKPIKPRVEEKEEEEDDDDDDDDDDDTTAVTATKAPKTTKKSHKKASKNPEPGRVNRAQDTPEEKISSDETNSPEVTTTKTTATTKTTTVVMEKSSESVSDDNKVGIADSVKHDDKTEERDLKHAVREEDGKLYAFAQSPDYDEYHEQLSRMLKHAQNKNEKKINHADKKSHRRF